MLVRSSSGYHIGDSLRSSLSAQLAARFSAMDFDSNDGTIIRKLQENIEELGQQVQHLDSFISRLTESEQHREQFNELAHKAQKLSKETNQLMKQLVQLSNNNALQQLEQDIGDVNQIFADLARIVHDQGDMVDSIEANVEHAQIHVEQQKRVDYHFYKKSINVEHLACFLMNIQLEKFENAQHAGSTNIQQAVYYNQKARQKKMLLFAFV
ncbi:SNARE domain protein, partial [Ostertagia ostertagi]